MNFENQPSEPFKQDINEYNPRYTFPLENQDDYRGLIRFLAYDEDYQSLAGLAFRTAAVAGVSEEVIDNFRAEGFSTKKGKANNKKNRGEVVLYLPQSIQISDNIQYGSIELGAIGATAMQGVAAGSGAVGLVGDALKSVMKDIASAAFGDLGDAGAAAAVQRTARRFSAPQIAGAVATSTGVTINPNNRNILNGVALRTFRFQFKLIPTSKREADIINKMIKWFRMSMYPDIGAALDETQGTSLTLKYPSKFKITMEYGKFSDAGGVEFGDTNPVATGLLPCFLQSFDAVYNPNAMAFHSDGNPQEVDISMNFIEERALNRNDVKDDRPDIIVGGMS